MRRRKDVMSKGICKYIGKSCPRFQIGENMERNGQKRRGRTVMQRLSELQAEPQRL